MGLMLITHDLGVIAQMAEQSTGAARASAMTAQQLNALAREMRTITDQYRL